MGFQPTIGRSGVDSWAETRPVLTSSSQNCPKILVLISNSPIFSSSDLKSLETDFEEFKTFLNDSYNNNDFYIKDITGAIIVLVDELAIKGHIQSLPNILNEIWQIMGESGEAIRKSLLWIIETVSLTTSHKKNKANTLENPFTYPYRLLFTD